MADEDLDLVALATVADVVPLLGENRRLVRQGLRRLASTRKPGLRALMDVAKVDPSTVDAGAIGFRLGPRLNAAGRLYRADAGLELLLTEDRERARAVALELDANNTERRDVETRIRFEAEAQVAEQGAGRRLRARLRGLARGRDRHRRRPHRRAPPPPVRADRARRPRGHGLRPLDPGLRPAGRPARRLRAPAALRRPPRRRRPHDLQRRRPGLPRGVRRPRRERPHPGGPAARGPRRRRRPRRRPHAQPRGGARAARPVRPGQPGRLPCSSRPRCSTTRARWGRAATSRSRSAPAGRAHAACCSAPARSCPPSPSEPVGAVVRLERNHWNGTTEPRLILRHAHRAVPARHRRDRRAGLPERPASRVEGAPVGRAGRGDPRPGLVDRRRRTGDPCTGVGHAAERERLRDVSGRRDRRSPRGPREHAASRSSR